MLYTFHNLKYCIWNLDNTHFQEFKKTTQFSEELERSFEEVPIQQGEALGLAYSHKHDAMNNFKSFGLLQRLINPSLDENLRLLNGSDFKILVRSWANRMHRDAYGAIHSHGYQRQDGSSYVLLVYFKVPENSANLVFINPNAYIKAPKQICDDFSDENKLVIPVSEGMCVLHDGRIPHGVSRHNSDIPREVLVFEFSLTN